MEERKLEPNKTFRGWSANMVLVKNIHPEFLNAHIYNAKSAAKIYPFFLKLNMYIYPMHWHCNAFPTLSLACVKDISLIGKFLIRWLV